MATVNGSATTSAVGRLLANYRPQADRRKVNRTITIRKSGGSIRPGVITAITGNNTKINARVSHGGETFTGIEHVQVVGKGVDSWETSR